MGTSSLTIRNIPQEVLDRLKERARQHRRSMQGEILEILEVASQAPIQRLSARQVVERVRALGVATPAESVELLRADRDGR